MKKTRLSFGILLYLTLILAPFTAQSPAMEEESAEVFAPFVSRFKAEPKGAAVLLSWKDARNMENPLYKIYASTVPLNKETLQDADFLAAVPEGTEQFVYEPGDGIKRYYAVLAEEKSNQYEVFIPYRNMNMSPVSAILSEVEAERATILSSLKVIPELQQMIISGISSLPERPVILFRSTALPQNREDLLKAARVTTLTGSRLNWKDQVVPGIPFYYALVDQDLFESGSTEILYEGSVTTEPVIIPLEEWLPEEAHTFQFYSRHIPLPVLNITRDIEKGKPLPGPALPDTPIELSDETARQLAHLNFGKSVRDFSWLEYHILPVDAGDSLNPVIEGIPLLFDNRDFEAVINRTTRELNRQYDKELEARLHYYRGQAYYFQNNMEEAFMDFLSARELYYTDVNRWLYNIFEQKELKTRTERVEF